MIELLFLKIITLHDRVQVKPFLFCEGQSAPQDGWRVDACLPVRPGRKAVCRGRLQSASRSVEVSARARDDSQAKTADFALPTGKQGQTTPRRFTHLFGVLWDP